MRFIHVADVHLGATPDLGYPWSENRKKEIWESFSGIIEQVKREKTELLLIAGDLFHGQPLMKECRELNFLLEQIPDTAVVLIAGNHDYIRKDSAYLKYPWAKNVVGMWDEKCQCCYLENCNTYVYGLSYHAREITESVYNRVFPGGKVNLRQQHPNAHHILLAHGGDDRHIPIHFSALADTDFDYIALGHIHQPQILRKDKMAYAGSLEPIDRNHLGPRGYIRGEIAGGKTTIEFVRFAKREYRRLNIAVTPDSSNGSIAETVRREIQQQGSHHIYRIAITGIKDPELEIQEDMLKAMGNVVEVTDDSEPEFDFEQIRQQYTGTAVSAYIDSFCEHKKAMTEVEKMAMYLGVRALLKAGE